MILLLSNSIFQPSIDDVIDWLRYFRVPFIRVNGLNVNEINSLLLTFNSKEESVIVVNGQHIIPAEIKAIWYYRWYHPQNYGDIKIDPSLSHVEGNIMNRLGKELDTVAAYFFHLFQDAYWLTGINSGIMNKLITLKQATEAGLDIPETVVVTTKEQLKAFKHKHKEIITKPVYELFHFEFEQHTYSSYTTVITDKIESLEPVISPTLLQEKIEKEFEIRSFYLEGKLYSMAIFSQNDKQTSLDFRKYNKQKPNRNVPYQLPADTEEKLIRLLQRNKLNTASIDLIKCRSGRHVFLEINPVGQFGMTSLPCNYYLEREIAKTLISYDH